MHRDHQLRPHIDKCLHGLFGIHMLRIHEPFRFIGPDRHQRYMQLKPAADLLKAREEAAVAGKIEVGRQLPLLPVPFSFRVLLRLSRFKHIPSPVGAVGVKRCPPGPVLGRHKCQLHSAQRKLLPPLHLMAVRKALAEHFPFQPGWYDNLGCRLVEFTD
ncbi:hypothetical protein D3C80_1645670 [compost metagenome]